MNTAEDDHVKGAYMMLTGRRQTPGGRLSPHRGRGRECPCSSSDDALPGHISITPGGGGGSGNDSAYLEPKLTPALVAGQRQPADAHGPA